jgi:hypothetical protein
MFHLQVRDILHALLLQPLCSSLFVQALKVSFIWAEIPLDSPEVGMEGWNDLPNEYAFRYVDTTGGPLPKTRDSFVLCQNYTGRDNYATSKMIKLRPAYDIVMTALQGNATPSC